MAIALEAFTVVVRREGLERLGGVDAFSELVPNSTFCCDEELARCAFMDRGDAVEFVDTLYLHGLETRDDEDPDVVLVTAFDGTMKPDCDWLQLESYKKGWIGWRTGSQPETISAPSSWDPELDSNLERMSTEEAAERLEFLRREENVEVFRDRKTGRELYVGRTGLPLDQMYEEAKEVVMTHLRNPGDPATNIENVPAIRRVIEMLQILTERRGDSWTVHWLLGKAWHALGDLPRAYVPLKKALELEPDNAATLREFAGICLEQGNAAEAIPIAEKAVTTAPDDAELLTNLAVALLLDGRNSEAQKTIAAAIRSAPDDQVAQSIQQLVHNVASGAVEPPRSLADLQAQPPPRAKGPFGWLRRAISRILP